MLEKTHICCQHLRQTCTVRPIFSVCLSSSVFVCVYGFPAIDGKTRSHLAAYTDQGIVLQVFPTSDFKKEQKDINLTWVDLGTLITVLCGRQPPYLLSRCCNTVVAGRGRCCCWVVARSACGWSSRSKRTTAFTTCILHMRRLHASGYCRRSITICLS